MTGLELCPIPHSIPHLLSTYKNQWILRIHFREMKRASNLLLHPLICRVASEVYTKHTVLVRKLPWKWSVAVRVISESWGPEEAGARAGMPAGSPDGKSGRKWSFGETTSYNSNFSLSSEPFSSACCDFSFKTNQLNLLTPLPSSCSFLLLFTIRLKRVVYALLSASHF